MTKLDEIRLSQTVSPHHPRGMCVTSSGKLLYTDVSNVVRWINPTSSGTYITTQTNTSNYRIQHVDFEEKELLILTCNISGARIPEVPTGLQVYNVKTKLLEWSVEGSLPGMDKAIHAYGLTTDDDGHLFVCDWNNACIQMFGVADGRYMGALIKKGEQGLGRPLRIKWCSRISSLVIIHYKPNKWHITVFKVERKN